MPKKAHRKPVTRDRRRSAVERSAARKGSALTRKRHLPATTRPSGQLAPVVQLPRLGQVDQEQQQAGPSKTERASRLSRWLWRHRWQLTPFTASAATVIGASGGAATSTALLVGAVGAAAHGLANRGPDTLGGRAWLSRRERTIAGNWSFGAAAWAACVEFGLWGVDVGGLLALGALTGLQTTAWLNSRKPLTAGGTGTLSGPAADLMAAWPHTIAVNGPTPLRKSHIVPASVSEPAPGALTFAVELAEDVHGQDAVGDDVRRRLERALYMGIGTVELATDRQNSALVRVTLTPTRHLELAPAGWDGPVLNEDGTMPLATERSSVGVDIALFNEDGVEHAGVFGTSGAGKSNTVVTMLLPGVVAGLETVWYIDGGQGTSAGHLAGACDWWAVDGPTEWEAVIAAAHTVMRARKARRTSSRWHGRAETDPVLTLCIDEASTVRGQISQRHHKMVAELLREGRKLGVRVIQITQDPMGDELIGGRVARGLMGGAGSLIGHRPGDGTANVLTGSSTSESIDLRALPPEPGWVGIIRRGTVLSRAARVRYAADEAVLDVLTDVTPRALAGEDLAAAGPAYRTRITGLAAAARMRGEEPASEPHTPTQTVLASPSADVDEPEHESAGGEVVDFPTDAVNDAAAAIESHSREVVWNTIRQHMAGITPARLCELTGLSKPTVKRRVRELADQGRIHRDTGTGLVRPVAS